MARRLIWLAPEKQAVLDQVAVRLIEPHEQPRWDDPIARRHYLKNATLVGEQLRYVAVRNGQWLALLGWSAAAYHLKGRDTGSAGPMNNGVAGCTSSPTTPAFCCSPNRGNCPIWPPALWPCAASVFAPTGKPLTAIQSW